MLSEKKVISHLYTFCKAVAIVLQEAVRSGQRQTMKIVLEEGPGTLIEQANIPSLTGNFGR